MKRFPADVLWQMTHEDILSGLREFDSGTVPHSFVNSTRYDLVHEGRSYPPKAVVGLALRRQLGRIPAPTELRGGEGTTTFLVLQQLGFKIVPKIPIYPDEIQDSDGYSEGAMKRVMVNRYERDPAARAACIETYGAYCHVCEFDFSKMYFGVGDGYIHVHHLIPLSEAGEEYQVDPIEDLRPVCPNCHAMLHQRRPTPYTIDEMRAIVKWSR
jgi:5-methylcytosine-specific restriction enzyme A